MTNPELTGFLTRHEASRLYNRSQRALERDLDAALKTQDPKLLVHWRLQTKDGVTRGAEDMDTETVKKLQADGQVPVWYVSESHIEQEFGRRGFPKPKASTASELGAGEHRRSVGRSSSQASATDPDNRLPDDIAFLKERIRTLEREKQAEVERNEKREAKLFAELDVKNQQISAWDEISQGLTKALATGQLAPALKGATRDAASTALALHDNSQESSIVDVPPPATKAKAASDRKHHRQPTKRPATSRSGSKRTQKKRAKKTSILYRDLFELFPFRRR